MDEDWARYPVLISSFVHCAPSSKVCLAPRSRMEKAAVDAGVFIKMNMSYCLMLDVEMCCSRRSAVSTLRATLVRWKPPSETCVSLLRAAGVVSMTA